MKDKDQKLSAIDFVSPYLLFKKLNKPRNIIYSSTSSQISGKTPYLSLTFIQDKINEFLTHTDSAEKYLAIMTLSCYGFDLTRPNLTKGSNIDNLYNQLIDDCRKKRTVPFVEYIKYLYSAVNYLAKNELNSLLETARKGNLMVIYCICAYLEQNPDERLDFVNKLGKEPIDLFFKIKLAHLNKNYQEADSLHSSYRTVPGAIEVKTTFLALIVDTNRCLNHKNLSTKIAEKLYELALNLSNEGDMHASLYLALMHKNFNVFHLDDNNLGEYFAKKSILQGNIFHYSGQDSALSYMQKILMQTKFSKNSFGQYGNEMSIKTANDIIARSTYRDYSIDELSSESDVLIAISASAHKLLDDNNYSSDYLSDLSI